MERPEIQMEKRHIAKVNDQFQHHARLRLEMPVSTAAGQEAVGHWHLWPLRIETHVEEKSLRRRVIVWPHSGNTFKLESQQISRPRAKTCRQPKGDVIQKWEP